MHELASSADFANPHSGTVSLREYTPQLLIERKT
jgi:hypothetical protein